MLAKISSEKLSEKVPLPPRNKLGKFLEKMLPPKALTLQMESDAVDAVDIRILIASLTLLDEYDITGVNRG